MNGLGDYFEFGLLPRIKGLYSKELLAFTDMNYVKPRIDAVFLSHAHFDHVEHIRFLDPKIPMFLGVGAKLFMECMEETSNFCNYGKHDYQTFRTGNKIRVGDVMVEPVHVDHSIPSAYGFLIHTSEGVVVYTGDLRVHGPRKDMTEDFMEKARRCDPVALICEGTRMVEKEQRKNYSEPQVETLSKKVVSSTGKAVFVSRYSRDIDRFKTFYNVAKDTGRKMVVSPKTAHLLDRLVHDKCLGISDPMKDENVVVYYKRKKSGRFEESDYYGWERKFVDKMVTSEFVRKNQKNILMDLDFYQFAELIDIKPDKGSHFIHSMSEPFSEEDIEDQAMHNWLSHFGMRFHQLHASGHMNRHDLTNLVKYVGARRIFPVHTENPQLFKRTGCRVQPARLGEEYSL